MPNKVTKKITKKGVSVETEVRKSTRPAVEAELGRTTEKAAKKVCAFCQNKTEPVYTDSVALKRYVSDRAKIVSRLRSGVCSKHQRVLSKHIKYARHLSLLPFVPKI